MPGLRHLRDISHGEDFVVDRDPLGITLTNLIKGGICKIELAQLLAADPDADVIRQGIAERGWSDRLVEWEAVFQETAPTLDQAVFEICMRRPELSAAEAGGASLGAGSDVPRQRATGDVLTILAVHAPPRPKNARIPVGRVVEYVAAQRPEIDYLFYCYGSSLMVCRRLNHADLSIDLGALMPKLGGDGDGGHGGAAVCRPCDHPDYPHNRLGRVNADTFPAFVDYLAHRLNDSQFQVIQIRNRSVASHRESLAKSSEKLLLITAAAFIVGLLLLLIPQWRPAAALDSNASFLPQLVRPDTVDEAEDAELAP